MPPSAGSATGTYHQGAASDTAPLEVPHQGVVVMEDPHLLRPERERLERRRAHAALDAGEVVEVLVEQVAALADARERVAVRGAERLLLGPWDVLVRSVHQVPEVEEHLVRV